MLKKHYKLFLGLLILACTFVLFEPRTCKDVQTVQPIINIDSIHKVNDLILNKVYEKDSQIVILNAKIDSLDKLKSKVVWNTVKIPYNIDTCITVLEDCINDVLICEEQSEIKDSIISANVVQIDLLHAGNTMYGNYLDTMFIDLNYCNSELIKTKTKVKQRNKIIVYLGVILSSIVVVMAVN